MLNNFAKSQSVPHKRGSNNEIQNTQMWINEISDVHLYDISQLITAKNDEKTVKQSEKTESNNEKEKKTSQKWWKVSKKHVKSINSCK